MLMIVASQCVPKHKNPEEASVFQSDGGRRSCGELTFYIFYFHFGISFFCLTNTCMHFGATLGPVRALWICINLCLFLHHV